MWIDFPDNPYWEGIQRADAAGEGMMCIGMIPDSDDWSTMVMDSDMRGYQVRYDFSSEDPMLKIIRVRVYA